MAELDRRRFLRLAGAGGLALAGSAGLRLAGPAPLADPLLVSRPLRELRREVRGRVLLRGEPGYETARLLRNERFDGLRPPAVVEVADARDVAAVFRWAARHDAGLTARSGGHSYGGYSGSQSGVVVDLRRLRRVAVSADGRLATVGAGVPLGHMYDALARRGVTVPAGTCPTVGISGLALGGGMGMASRALGLTCDSVASISIVTPDGRHREVDESSGSDLFWACRGGGGGNFGIATSFTFRTHPVSAASHFRIAWPWAQADAALDAWQRFAPEAPDALTSLLILRSGEATPEVTAIGQLFGSETDLRRLLAPLLTVEGAQPELGTLGYGELMKHWAGCTGEGAGDCLDADRSRFRAKSDFAAKPFGARGRADLLARVEAGLPLHPGGGSVQIILDAYGGAINRVGRSATAFVHRDQSFSLQYLATHGPSTRGRAVQWIDRTHSAMRPHVSGQAYQNYIDPLLEGWEQAYYGQNLERLAAVGSRYDPDWRLRFAQGIRPTG